MPTVFIDGVEYVPKPAVIPPITDDNLLRALQELTYIQYFHDLPHKHRARAWDALDALAPELAALAAEDPQAAYEQVHGREA